MFYINLNCSGLTKVEIRGPWIHALCGIVAGLVAAVPNIETLALTHCSLDDTELTGLSESAVMDARRCLTPGLMLLLAGPDGA